MEDYFGAKASALHARALPPAVVCVDDDWGGRLAAEATVPVVTARRPRRRTADGAPTVVAGAGTAGASPCVHAPTGRPVELRSPPAGPLQRRQHRARRARAAALGLAPTEVAAAMSVAPDVPGRMEVVDAGGPGPRCVVDFAHTPDAVDAALAALRASTRGPALAVLGAGGDRDRGKRRPMGAAAAAGPTSSSSPMTTPAPRTRPRSGRRSSRAREAVRRRRRRDRGLDGARGRARSPRPSPLAVVAGQDRPVDTVLVLGKGHEKGQEIARSGAPVRRPRRCCAPPSQPHSSGVTP